MSSWLWRAFASWGGPGCVCQSVNLVNLLDTPKKTGGHGFFDGTKTASLCQIWPEKLISLLQVSRKESKLNFWICFFFGASPKSAVLRWFATDIMWIFFARCCFPKHKSSPVDVTWIFPDARVHVVGPWFLVRVALTQTGCSMTASEPCAMRRPAKSFGGSPRGIAYAAYFSCRPTQLVEPPTDLVIYSYKAWDMFQRNKSRSNMTR